MNGISRHRPTHANSLASTLLQVGARLFFVIQVGCSHSISFLVIPTSSVSCQLLVLFATQKLIVAILEVRTSRPVHTKVALYIKFGVSISLIYYLALHPSCHAPFSKPTSSTTRFPRVSKGLLTAVCNIAFIVFPIVTRAGLAVPGLARLVHVVCNRHAVFVRMPGRDASRKGEKSREEDDCDLHYVGRLVQLADGI